ncbi:MAG: HD domain-containing protein [Bacteroidota bacterium]
MDYKAAKAYILHKLERELSDQLFYHGLHHTLDVLKVTIELCESEGVGKRDTILLKTAALYHDAGFVVHNVQHEQLGCQLAQASLPQFGYTAKDIERICGMIMATKIPQSPKNALEEIICDADLDYLGRDDFKSIGDTLYEELKAYDVLSDVKTWNRLQVSFLEGHTFFTKTNLERRQGQKEKHLMELRDIVASYEKN